MILRNLFLFVISCYFFSCSSGQQSNIDSTDKVLESTTESESNTTYFEGRFYKIEKIDQRSYWLQLKADDDSIITFLTMMPLSDAEIQLLNKDGNNVKLNYSNFFNPVKKVDEKIVKSVEYVYDFGKK